MNEGLYPLTEKLFKALVEPIIEKNYTWKGRPPKISHYQVFCAILYNIQEQVNLGEIDQHPLANGIRYILAFIEEMKGEYGGKY